MARAFANGPITEYEKKKECKALIGLRQYNNPSILVIKSPIRNKNRNGRILRRPCIWNELAKETARPRRPIHTDCPFIQQRVKPENYLFPSFTKSNINRVIKRTMISAGFGSGGLPPARAPRRGGTREIIAAGPTLFVILTPGAWTSTGYRSYIDTPHLDLALNVARIAIEQATRR